MALTKHTTIVNMYLEQKATRDEIYTFIQTINKRLASGFPGDDSGNPYPEENSEDIFIKERGNPDNLSQNVINHILKKELLMAVKLHKDEKGLGLKEAKDAIDKYRETFNI